MTSELVSADPEQICKVLENIFLRESAHVIAQKQPRWIYYSKRLPDISLLDYVTRFEVYLQDHSDGVCFVITLIYMTRLLAVIGYEYCTPYTVYRMFLACALVSYKFCYDISETNSYFARIGGVSLRELNNLETSTLMYLDYNLAVSESEYSIMYELIKPSSTEFSNASSCSEVPFSKPPRAASLVK